MSSSFRLHIYIYSFCLCIGCRDVVFSFYPSVFFTKRHDFGAFVLLSKVQSPVVLSILFLACQCQSVELTKLLDLSRFTAAETLRFRRSSWMAWQICGGQAG